ncbi:hypothetical protein [Azotobacter beijerinckii]|uniref:hypothetical protein n=1 Tax=Azotobacter beijerinckii TaxID=170623 RepID=UPI0029545526|nr:hypothetical protein [Azotobacter beijerinckii]MDV7209946.1 hypothetical protein [Azotobacter beijerinckii]
MPTPEKLRSEIEDARRAAHAAPNKESARSDWARVSRLEAELRKLEGREETEDQRMAERFRIEMIHASNRAERAEHRVRELEWLLEQQIGEPVKKLSRTTLGIKLTDIKNQRAKLAAAIDSASDIAGLERAKRIAINMGLIKRKKVAA